jgi:hypothetical protein
MSTVLPAAAALLLELLLALLLLLLLLQPAAAKAIAAKAAIAVVRLMMFLSFIEVVRLPRERTDRPGSGSWPGDSRGVVGSTGSFTATAPPRESIPARPRAWRTSPQAPRPAISLP